MSRDPMMSLMSRLVKLAAQLDDAGLAWAIAKLQEMRDTRRNRLAAAGVKAEP